MNKSIVHPSLEETTSAIHAVPEPHTEGPTHGPYQGRRVRCLESDRQGVKF